MPPDRLKYQPGNHQVSSCAHIPEILWMQGLQSSVQFSREMYHSQFIALTKGL